MRVIIPEDTSIQEIILDLSDCYTGNKASHIPNHITEYMLIIPRNQLDVSGLDFTSANFNPLLDLEFAYQLDKTILAYINSLQEYIDDLINSGVEEDELSKRYAKLIKRIQKSKITEVKVVNITENDLYNTIDDNFGNVYNVFIDSLPTITNQKNLNIEVVYTKENVLTLQYLKEDKNTPLKECSMSLKDSKNDVEKSVKPKKEQAPDIYYNL